MARELGPGPLVPGRDISSGAATRSAVGGRHLRRGMAAGLALTAAAALAACGGSGSGSSGSLTVWHEFSGAGNKAMQNVVHSFNAKNPKDKFTAREIANDQVNTVIRTGLSGKNPPTVVQYEGYQQTADYAKAGQLLDITSWWNKHKSAFTYGDSKAVSDACQYNGKVYCIPWNVDSSNQLYYDPTLVKKYKLPMPKKVSDLTTIADKLKGSGVSAVSLYAGEGWPAAHWWYLFSIQRCGIDTVLKAAKQQGAKWDDSCFEQAANDLYELGKAGVFNTGVGGSDYNHMMALFLSGKTAFMNTGTWFNSTVAATPPKTFKVATVAFPQLDPSRPSKQILGGFTNVIGLSAKSGNTAAGYKFLNYLATPAAGRQFAKASLINVVKGAQSAMPANVKVSFNTISKALALPGTNVVSYFENLVPTTVGEDAMYNGAQGLADGSTTPKAMVKSVQDAAATAAATQ
jgi:raffinose/stachyose/melibiose transport system substrate-binding protein